MDENELKQMKAEIIQLQQAVNAQSGILILLLAVSRTAIAPHRADIDTFGFKIGWKDFDELMREKGIKEI